RHRVIVMPARVPICHASHDGEDIIGRPGAVLILDAIEECDHIAALDARKLAVLPSRHDMPEKNALDIAPGAQPFRLNMALEPIVGDGPEAIRRDGRRLECWQAGADALECRARLLAGFFNLGQVNTADGRPYLLAAHRVACNGTI